MEHDHARRHWAEQRLATQYTISRILAEFNTLKDAAPKILEAMVESLECDYGALWIVDWLTNLLRCAGTWRSSPAEFIRFEAQNWQMTFAPDVGLPGRIWTRKEPDWIADLLEDRNFPRLQVAATEGLSSGFGFPILLENTVLGVFEFFSRTIHPPDPEILDMMAALGSQIGQFVRRKRAEESLRESEARKAAMLDASLDAIVTIDHTGKILEFNAAAERIFGYQRTEILGQEIGQFIVPPGLRAEHYQGLARYLATGEAHILNRRLELVAMRADGSEFPVELTVTRISTEGPPIFTGFIRDISERKQTEAALRLSEDRFRSLVEQSPLSTQILTPDGYTLQVNRAWEELWGVTLDQISDYNMLHDPQLVAKGIMPYIQKGFAGEATEIPAIVYDPNETIPGQTAHSDPRRWVRAVIYPVKDASGKIREVVLIHEDVTDRWRAEAERERLLQQLQAERERLAFLARASSILGSSLEYETTLPAIARLAIPYLGDWCWIHIVKDDGSLVRVAASYADPATEQQAMELDGRYPITLDDPHGPGRVILTGQPEWVNEITDDWLESVARDPGHLQILRQMNIQSYISVPLLARERILGAMTFVCAGSGLHCDAQGLALAEELARRSALAVDNARLYREAQEAIRARDQFLSIASHELKTPLTSIMGYTQLLELREQTGKLSDRDRRALQVIARQAGHLNKLVSALLDISRIQTGQLSLEQKPLDLNALVRRFVGEAQPRLQQHTIEYQGSGEPVPVEGDEVRLEQVLQNLVENAIKYSPAGGPIRIAVRRCEEQACVSVSDQGIGIPAEALPRLFSRFYRAKNVDARQISGMGMGLFVVREIVHLHGGNVEVTSQEGQGSTFTVCLPCSEGKGNNH